MSHLTQDQQKLVKARKAARVLASLLIFGGAALLLVGIIQQSLPGVMNGVTMMAGSAIPFVFAYKIERKINLPQA